MGQASTDPAAQRDTRLGRIFCLVVVLVFLGSFFLPVFDNTNAPPPAPGTFKLVGGVVYGYNAFILGIFQLTRLNPVWFANLALWLGARALPKRQWKQAALGGGVGLPLSLCGLFLLLDKDLIHEQQFLAGYYVWVGSMALLFAAGVYGLLKLTPPEEKKETKAEAGSPGQT